MEVLASRILLRPVDLDRSQRFYRDVLGLAVYREFGDPPHRGVVYFLGGGFLEIYGIAQHSASANLALWLQVRDIDAKHQRLAARAVESARPTPGAMGPDRDVGRRPRRRPHRAGRGP